jgi:hypothetical protein
MRTVRLTAELAPEGNRESSGWVTEPTSFTPAGRFAPWSAGTGRENAVTALSKPFMPLAALPVGVFDELAQAQTSGHFFPPEPRTRDQLIRLMVFRLARSSFRSQGKPLDDRGCDQNNQGP